MMKKKMSLIENTYKPTSALDELKALIQDSIAELERTNNQEEDLWELKLLQARNNCYYFEEDLAEFICGDHKDYPYLKGWELELFFSQLGFTVPSLTITRRIWVKNELLKLNINDIIKIIQYGLFEKRKFKQEFPEDFDDRIDKAEETFKTFINDCISSNQGADLNKLLDLNINVELLFSNTIVSKDEEINTFLEQARQKFFDKNEKQIAVEKLWDAFERIKTYLDKDKKKGSTELVNTLNDKIISCDFEKEFIILGEIGNNNMIRHTETDKNKINDPNYLDYLFFRMLSLLNLCLKEIDKVESRSD